METITKFSEMVHRFGNIFSAIEEGTLTSAELEEKIKNGDSEIINDIGLLEELDYLLKTKQVEIVLAGNLPKDAVVFHSSDSDFEQYSGKTVKVLRVLSPEEADFDEVGLMYEVRFSDGKTSAVFADELEF